jgi:hypothetical protein
MWLAALPAVFLMMFSFVTFSRVGTKIKPEDHAVKSLSCIDTYGVTLNLSDQYVPAPESTVGTWSNNTNNKTPQISTVVRGVARNNCGENLKNVRLKFVVHDDGGASGDGFYLFDDLSNGEVKTFERAWMGRVTSYEITAGR